jgi:Flp pilus assembly protein TadG
MCKRTFVKFWRNRRAAATVEMTAILPFLLVLGGGIFEFGAFFYQYQMVQVGVRDAARYLSRVTNTASSLTPCDAGVLATKESNAKDIAVMGLIGGSTKRVSWWSQSDITITYPTVANAPDMTTGVPPYRGPDPLVMISVSTSPNYPGVGFLSFLGLNAPLKINLSHQERCIGEG